MATTRPFFGGAIACDVPQDWRDVSDIRQVPDHQECWQDTFGRVLVVEILARQAEITDAQAAEYFFKDLAEANGTTPADMQFVPQGQLVNLMGLPETATLCFGTGYQKVAIGRDTDIAGNPRTQEVRSIRVELCAIRLAHVATELLVTLSSPSEAIPQGTPQPTEAFVRILGSLQIQDWGLFG